MFYSRIQVICSPEFSELLIAEMGEAGFDSFLETDTGFEAYAEGENYDNALLQFIKDRYGKLTKLQFVHDRVEKENWNAVWEKNYQPIVVEDTCLIRADFHKIERTYPYELIITPKMSFGTGHHETTYLMIKQQLSIDHRQKRVMDAGCGTAILSIMASKLGARAVEAFDIDEWSVSNGKENITINGCSNIQHQQGKLSELNFEGKFDIILANINKNVLLDEMPLYTSYLSPGGLLLLSGFYESDITDLLSLSNTLHLKEAKRAIRENWASLLLMLPA